MFVRLIRPAVSLLALMTVLLGIVYPLVITGVAKVAFPRQAEGSLIYNDGKLIGSTLIGQSFSDPKYFWGRPSATTPQPYNGLASTGSNLGPLNPALLDAVKANAKALHDADPDNRQSIPVDLVTASASGLDPDIRDVYKRQIKGVKYRALGAGPLLRQNLLIYGLGGIIVPFPGIKLIDMILSAAGWA